MVANWNQGDRYNSGRYFGEFQKVFVDYAEEHPALEGTKRDDMAPAQFVAGWYYGVSTEDKRDDILKCFTKSEDLTNVLYDAMEAYIAGDSKTGDKKMKDSKKLWDTAMAGCGQIAVAMGDVSKKFEDMQAQSDWDKVSKEIYQANKAVIDRDVDFELKTWSEGVWFNSGMFAGQIEKIFLDQMPEEEELSHFMFMTPF